MKATHRPDVFSYCVFDETRDLDFNATFIQRAGGNVLIDPVAASEHDLQHMTALGGVAQILVTNSDHIRQAPALAERFGAQRVGPEAEREAMAAVCPCDRWLRGGDAWIDGIEVIALAGSKTPGELALVLDGTTLITGDLIRGHIGGALNLLPAAKLTDPDAARASVRRLAQRVDLDAVLVGDGWPIFSGAHAQLVALATA